MRLESLGCEAAIAAEAMRAAALFVRERGDDINPGTLTKTDTSPVTVLDFALQAFLISRLLDHFPADSIVAEEDAGALRAADAASLRLHVVKLVRP